MYEKYLDGEIWTRRYIGSALIEEPLDEILPEGTLHKTMLLNIPRMGEYQIELMVQGDNAGFDKKEVFFEVIGERGCTFENCSSTQIEGGECKIRCNCSNCMLSSNCGGQAKQQVKDVWTGSEHKEIDLSQVEMVSLSSNLVEFVLPQQYCE